MKLISAFYKFIQKSEKYIYDVYSKINQSKIYLFNLFNHFFQKTFVFKVKYNLNRILEKKLRKTKESE